MVDAPGWTLITNNNVSDRRKTLAIQWHGLLISSLQMNKMNNEINKFQQ
jgi:hypothetical protein